MSTAISPPGAPQNRPKAYEVNSRRQWCCTKFVSPAINPKPSNFEEFSRRAF